MRVALVHRDLHALAGGGICTLYRALAPRLRDAGHEVVLIIQHTSNPLVLNGIRVYTLPRTDDLNIVVANGVERDRFHPGPVILPTSGVKISLDSDATAASSQPLSGIRDLPPPGVIPARGGAAWCGYRPEQLAFDLNDLARRSPCCSATARLCRRSLCPSPRTA